VAAAAARALGVVVATPLAAALVVAVKMLYVEDVLEADRPQPRGIAR
jgi:hypothetical protein